MRRLLLLALLALAIGPESASAEGFHLDFGGPGGSAVRAYGFEDCPGVISCDATPVRLTLERDGAVVESAGPASEPSLASRPVPGDVVRLWTDGVERAAVPFDGAPIIDDTSCAVVGGTRLGGTFRHGTPGMRTMASPGYGLLVDDYTYLRFAIGLAPAPGMADAVIATAGDRWSAEFPRPIRADEQLVVGNAYTIATPVGSATVFATRFDRICPSPPPIDQPPPLQPAAACTAAGLRADPAFRTRLERSIKRLRLRALRRGAARLTELPSCAGGTVAIEVKSGGAVVAKAIATATGAAVTQALTRTRRTARLAGRRRAKVKVTIRIADAAGGAVSWSRKLTLR